MINQKSAGFCLSTNITRIFQYFGRDVTSNEIGLLLNSSAGTAQDLDEATELLGSVAPSLDLNVVTVLDIRDHILLGSLRKYNTAAMAAHSPDVDLSTTTSINELFRHVNPDIWLRIKANEDRHIQNFAAIVLRSLQDNIPLLWSVQFGLIRDPAGPSASEGHVRLIVGLTPIFYSFEVICVCFTL